MDQHQFVEDCYLDYAARGLEPGNPLYGEWHEAHYPEPKCLGGTKVILLLKEDHAVQGVLQSEEYGHPCIWGWEKPFLCDPVLDLWKKWMAIKAQPAAEKTKETPKEILTERGRMGSRAQSLEDKIKGGVACMAKLTYEEKLERCKAMKESITPDKEAQRLNNIKKSLLAKNPNHFRDMGLSARSKESKEVKAARARSIPPEAVARGRDKTNSRKFRCLVTGKVSTSGPLTRYQLTRGIDPSPREEITNHNSIENQANE